MQLRAKGKPITAQEILDSVTPLMVVTAKLKRRLRQLRVDKARADTTGRQQ